MNTPVEFRARLTGQVDREAGIISNVTICTANLKAKGHDLWTDSVTLEQMAACANAKVQVPVRTKHGGGVSDVIGWIQNVRVAGAKLKGDLHLLESFAGREHFLEIAATMPTAVGLSAAFTPPEKEEKIGGKIMARCQDLIAVDFSTQPATNPTGLFGDDAGDITPRQRVLAAKLQVWNFAHGFGRRDRAEDPQDGAGVGPRILRAAALGSLAGAAVALRPTGGPVASGSLRPGDVIDRPFGGGIARHRGVVVAGAGGMQVVHAGRRPGEHGPVGRFRLVREPLGDFARQGQASLRIHPASDAARQAAAKAAAAAVGKGGRYGLVGSNSDDALRRAGIPGVNSQVRRALAGAGIGGALGVSAAMIRARLRARKANKPKEFSTMSSPSHDTLATLAAVAGQELIELEKYGLGSTPDVYPRLRGVLEFSAGAPSGGLASRALAALRGLPLTKTAQIAGAAAGGALLGRAFTKRRREDEEQSKRSGLLRRAARASVAGYAGYAAGEFLRNSGAVRAALNRLKARGGIVGRVASSFNPRAVGAVAGGLADATFFESVADDSAVFFEARIPSVSEAAARHLAITVAQHTGPGYGKSGHTAKTIARRTGLSEAEALRLIDSGQLRPAKSRRPDDPVPAFFERDVEKIRAVGLRQIALDAFTKRRAEVRTDEEASGLVALDVQRAVAIRDEKRG